MKHAPPVTPIFPRNNGQSTLKNLPIRTNDNKNHVLKSAGFYEEINHTLPTHHSIASTQPLNCVTIAQHIDTCPICSRLYDTDKTLYILAILGLLVLCFLMVKRIVKI